MAISTLQVNDSATTVYTSTNNTAVTWMSFTNYSAGTVLLDINLVPSGGSVADTNLIVNELEIAAKDTYQVYAGGEKLLLSNGDFIVATANSASAITVVSSYTTI